MIVFVHGVPETAAIWRKVQAAVGRESTALSLPGFGGPRPDGFGATKDEYVDGIVEQLDAIGEPVDLVGHDWGAILVARIAGLLGDRLRSWAIDCGGLMHPDYVWHAFAQIWQTPGEGEAFMANQQAQPAEEAAAGLAQIMSISEEDALEMARGQDATMDACILDLYRSAVPNPYADWGPFTPSAPGMVIQATDDPFADPQLSREAADQLGAQVGVLEGTSHFWPYQNPEGAAALLTGFWSTIG